MVNFIKKSLFVFQWVFCCLYLLSSLVYVVSPAQWWPMGILGICFPYLWVLMAVFFLVAFLRRKKIALIWLLGCLAAWPLIKNIAAFHFPHQFVLKKPPGQLRIMQWNCNGFEGIDDSKPAIVALRHQAIAFIKQSQPDIIIFQELAETSGKDVQSNISYIKDSLGYPYYIFHPYYYNVELWGKVWTGNAIFSKYPISDSGYVAYSGKRNPEGIAWANVQFGNSQCRVVATHLQSMHLGRTLTSPKLKSDMFEDSLTILHGNMLSKFKYFQPYHVAQAAEVRAFLDTCPTPLFFAADLNSVPSSFVYKKIRGTLGDSFLEKGSGFGRTYHSRQPFLRIDYLLHSSQLRVNQCSVFPLLLSDHDPFLADFTF